jgi:hypothetical protein
VFSLLSFVFDRHPHPNPLPPAGEGAKPVRLFAVGLLATLVATTALAINAVNPTGVNVRSNAPNTVFITFQGLEPNERAVEALWCGTVLPGVGAGSVTTSDPCVPNTLFGRLPLNFDRSRPTQGVGQKNFSDIMVIPASVLRRAVQEGIEGKNSDFFYVRHFTGGSGGDKWAVVTCRLGAGGARSPLSLIDVKVNFSGQADTTQLFVLRSGVRLPRFAAEIQYNGSGQLKGRWELVRPGDSEPEVNDLLTEATLPLELRGTQKRYTTVARFSQFLMPNSLVTLDGPDPALLDTRVEGSYQVLLRIEATDDKEANSEIGNGQLVKTGGVAGFSMPTLRYFVGDTAAANAQVASLKPNMTTLDLMLPLNDAAVDAARAVTFEWIEIAGATSYRIEVESAGKPIITSTLQGTRYVPPPSWIAARVVGNAVWQVTALDGLGRAVARSEVRRFVLRL